MANSTAARMFFDASCGPCTAWARLTEGLSRAPVVVYPLDGPEADRDLCALSEGQRYNSFHIVESGRTWSGEDAMPAWVGLLGGSRAQRVAERAPPVNRLLRIVYHRFWEYRRTRGCVAEGAVHG